jgi:hypothetical protein
MAKDDARDPFNAIPYDPRVVSVIGEVELLNEVRERLLQEGTPRHGPYGVETYEQVIELRRGCCSHAWPVVLLPAKGSRTRSPGSVRKRIKNVGS